jgi:hypothetical protein
LPCGPVVWLFEAHSGEQVHIQSAQQGAVASVHADGEELDPGYCVWPTHLGEPFRATRLASKRVSPTQTRDFMFAKIALTDDDDVRSEMSSIAL